MRRTLTILACMLLSPTLHAAPPATPEEPVVDRLHGAQISDPYRWLEGDAQGRLTPRVARWTDTQNAYTRAQLDGLPGRAAVERRLHALMSVGSVGLPTVRKTLVFYRARRGDQNQSVLYVRQGHDGPPRVLLDPNALDAKGLVSLDWTEPSDDGRHLAFGISRAGDENSTLHVLDTATGEWLADVIPNKAGGVDWLPDGHGFFYRCLEDPRDAYSGRIRFHRLGTHPRHDRTLVAQEGTTWGPFAWSSPDARWLLLGNYTSTRSNDLWVVDLDRWFRTGELVRTEILVGADARISGEVHGDTLYARTNHEAPNGRVVAIDLHRPGRAHWRALVAERKDAALRGLQMARGLLVVSYLHRAATRIERVALDGRALGPLPLPGIGSARAAVSRDRTQAYLEYSSFNEPPTIYRVDLTTGARSRWARPEVPVDGSTVVVRQVRYPSKDGTQVTMFLVHRKGLVSDGNNPTLLSGYGGFNIPKTPRFSATLFPWLEAGGVYAVPNLRGGGEYGAAWHKAGQLANKQNVFDDFIAAAEYLIREKITRPARLAISGRSNGGLLTGAVLVQRPELFRAVVVGVPLLDMLRYQRFLMARFWVPEYGTAEDAEQFAFLRRYSPYHNVKPRTAYPAVLLTAGENDARVHPCHARKMAARLQAATTGDQPILLWVDRQGGHGRGKPLTLRVRDITDTRMFLRWQLGMLAGPQD